MKYRFSLIAFLLVGLLASSSLASSADDKEAPAWLKQAARSSVPSYDKDVPAVVLHNETIVAVNNDGTLVTTTYQAIKILLRGGRNYAEAGAAYLQSASKVRDIRAWLIRADGTSKFFGKDRVLDAVSDPDDIYDENRVKTIDASGEADVGMTFGFETVVEERPLFTQDGFAFQRRLPCLLARYTLNLPNGWKATSVTFNRDEIKPAVTGTSYVWELRNLDPIPPEPDGLSARNLSPRIAVNYFPPSANAHVYDSWRDVSRWYTDLSADSLTLDDTVAAKARELTATATNDFDRIRMIAEFVQSMRYISLDIGIARGGGHRPRPASLVLQRGFGDCKDKANLMRTMLKALKIESYLVLIYSGDPTFVRAEWASPSQFNHCIIAVRVGPDVNSPSLLTSEKLGRLLIFDATDPYTQLGDLPEDQQGSQALLAAGTDGDLVKMPTLPPDANRMEREAEIELSPDGGLSGRILQKSYGQSASYERGRLRVLSATEYKADIESWLSSRVKGGTLTKVLPTDRKPESKFDLDMEFSARSYAQVMQNRLMMFKPAMVGRLDSFTPVEGKRVTPILIDSSSYKETIKVKLPEGFVVDEIPEAQQTEAPFGKYSATYEISGAFLLITRNLVLNRTIVPPTGYEDVRKFFGVVRGAEISPVVLMKK